MDNPIAFTVEYNRSIFFSQAGLVLFMGGWFLSAVAGAVWSAWDLRRRGQFDRRWPLVIFLGGSLVFPYFAWKSYGAKKSAAALWLVLVVVPAAVIYWSTARRFAIMENLERNYRVAPLQP